MLALRVLKNVRYIRQFRHCKCSSVSFQGKEINAEGREEIRKRRRFLRQLSELELKPVNSNFVSAIFGGGFDKEIFEYPQVFREKDISTIIDHSAALEEFLSNNSRIKINEEAISELNECEVFGLSIPQEYGGAGYNRTEVNFLLECSGIESHVGRFLGYNEDYGCRILSIYGNEEQKAKYLPRLADGRSRIALAFLEDASMVDFSNFVGYSISDSQNQMYVLNTKKRWVHNADVADLIMVLAKTTTVQNDNIDLVKFNMFLVERDCPNVKIHKVVNNYLENFCFYEVELQDVVVPEKNLVGSLETCGIEILKTALSHGFLTDAVFCCSFVKQIIHSAYAYIEENKVLEKLEKGYIMTMSNLSSLSMYAFVIESVAYLLSGRFDTHESHDLFDESVLGKIIAVDMLKSAIEKYIEIVGNESLKESGVLKDALDALHYYSIMDENIGYLKMMIGGNGLCFASVPLSEGVKKFRNIHSNFTYAIKEMFKNINAEEKFKKKYNLKQELHSSLDDAADLLEKSLSKFIISVEENLIEYGNEVMHNEYVLLKFAEIAAYLYAITACLSRASSSICYDFEKLEIDFRLAQKFSLLASSKIESLIDEELQIIRLTLMLKEVGDTTFKNKGYPAQHPLMRTY